MKLIIESMDEVKVAFEMLRLSAKHTEETGFELIRTETLNEGRVWTDLLQGRLDKANEEVGRLKERLAFQESRELRGVENLRAEMTSHEETSAKMSELLKAERDTSESRYREIKRLEEEVAFYKQGHEWLPSSYRPEQVIAMTPFDIRRVRSLPRIVPAMIKGGMVKSEGFEGEGDPMKLYRMAVATMAEKP